MNAAQLHAPPPDGPRVGLEHLLARPGQAAGWGRTGLLTNPSGVTRDLTPAAVALARAGLTPERLFGPEHGVDGSGAPGEAPELERDAASGLPTTVLYHLSAEETARRLAGLDTLIVDLQDVGVRFYTYVSTVRDVLRAARLRPLRIVILDRPNPLGFTVEGPLLDPAFESYVGISAQLPLRHGLTIGEVTRVLAAAEGVPVHVIPTDAP
ncbi:exo-beta-N-acetylmuramidase NamZ domain-containing protein, partial [Deinococcus sp. 6YEL10]|uniref:exo-beta-N-acetylmuramidase NamZ domain-containing protein n=1 Tax=Deinococcus sp. 6YEL10 TaxID=2745870 RepID=UPI001E45C70F